MTQVKEVLMKPAARKYKPKNKKSCVLCLLDGDWDGGIVAATILTSTILPTPPPPPVMHRLIDDGGMHKFVIVKKTPMIQSTSKYTTATAVKMHREASDTSTSHARALTSISCLASSAGQPWDRKYASVALKARSPAFFAFSTEIEMEES